MASGAGGGGGGAGLPEHVRAKVQEHFQQLDADGDGVLSFGELEVVLKKLHPQYSQNDLQRLFCEIDRSGNGKVEVAEFLDYVLHNKRPGTDVLLEPPQGAARPAAVRERWRQQALQAHNALRALHGCPPLGWSEDCYARAKRQADECQARGSMLHGHLEGPSGRHGQNVFWCSRPGTAAPAVVRSWYDELTDPGYDFGAPGSNGGTGHFTAVVWRRTTSVGMAASEDGRFIVANYYPAGNVRGQFGENVPAPDSAPVPLSKAGAPASTAAPQSGAGGPHSASAVSASEMTPEMDALLAGCPFLYTERIEAALAQGGTTVTVSREQEGETTTVVVTIKEARGTRRMQGSWGGGCQ